MLIIFVDIWTSLTLLLNSEREVLVNGGSTFASILFNKKLWIQILLGVFSYVAVFSGLPHLSEILFIFMHYKILGASCHVGHDRQPPRARFISYQSFFVWNNASTKRTCLDKALQLGWDWGSVSCLSEGNSHTNSSVWVCRSRSRQVNVFRKVHDGNASCT
jgi:hypothetical protein